MRCPRISGNQLSLLKFCIPSLDPRPEFQVTQGRIFNSYFSCILCYLEGISFI